MRNVGKRILALTLGTCMLLSMTACAPKEEKKNEAPKATTAAKAKSITIGITNSPSDCNPVDPGDNASTYMAELMFSPLVSLTSDMKYQPMLADSITTKDFKVFTVKLNEKAQWSDGQPITADDVIFTVKFTANPLTKSMVAHNLSALEGFDKDGLLQNPDKLTGVKKVDAHTLEFVTKSPMSLNLFQDNIAKALSTVPAHIWKDLNPAEYAKSPEVLKPTVISGPFKLVAFQKDQSVQFEANKNYFKGAPKLAKLNFKILQGTDYAIQLQSGEVDMNMPLIGTIPSSDYEKVKGIENIRTTSGKPSTVQFMFQNHKVLSDPRVRQAISCAIDRDMIVKSLLKGQGEAVDSFFTSTNPYKDASRTMTAFDPAKAKALLKEAKWDSSKVIRFNVPTGNKTREQVGDVIAQNLKDVGFNVQVNKLDFPTTMANCKKGDYELAIMGDTLVPTNPTYDLPFFVTSGNYNSYSNPTLDKLVDQIGSEIDDAKVKEKCAQMQAILAKDAPMTLLYATNEFFAINKRVVVGEPKDYGTFADVQNWDVTQ